MLRHCLHYFLFGSPALFQDMYYDGTHSSTSSTLSIIVIRTLTGVFFHSSSYTFRPDGQPNVRQWSQYAVRLHNLHLLATIGGQLFTSFSFLTDKQRRQYHAGEAGVAVWLLEQSRALLFYFMVWLATDWMVFYPWCG